MTSLFILGRVIFGGYFLYQGINHFKHQNNMAGYAKSKGVPQPKNAVLLTGVLLVAGGAGVVLNVYFQTSVLLLLVFLVPTTFIMHQFWKDTDANQKMTDHISFFKNVALIGACLMLLAL